MAWGGRAMVGRGAAMAWRGRATGAPATAMAWKGRAIAGPGTAMAAKQNADGRDPDPRWRLSIATPRVARSLGRTGAHGSTIATEQEFLRRSRRRRVRFCKCAKLVPREQSGREDSNLRLLGPEPSALPGCATPRFRRERSRYGEHSRRAPLMAAGGSIVNAILPASPPRVARLPFTTRRHRALSVGAAIVLHSRNCRTIASHAFPTAEARVKHSCNRSVRNPVRADLLHRNAAPVAPGYHLP
jgi:hypothetical protein